MASRNSQNRNRNPLLHVQELKTYFYTLKGTVKAVDDVNLIVNRREAVALVGESGCGKTTLGFSIMREVAIPGRIVGGKILFKGNDLLKMSRKEILNIRRKHISMVFQDPMTYLNPVFTIGDQILECILLVEDVTKKEAKVKTIEALRSVGMPSPSEIVRHYPFQLSGGMRQRVLLAMAISTQPTMIIADEPTTNLDVTVQAQVLDLIRTLIKRSSISLLLITHDLGVVADICDRIYVMYAGKIVEVGNVFEVFNRPRHPYTIGLLRCVMSIDEFKEKLVSINGAVPNLVNPPSGCRFHPRCPIARSVCREKDPPLVETEKDHFVVCWGEQ